MLKAGDKIRIKTWEEMLDYENIYEDIYGNLCKRGDNTEYFIPSMKKYCNRIIYVNDYYDETVYHNGWKFFKWTYEILGDKENENKSEYENSKYEEIIKLSKEDPIKFIETFLGVKFMKDQKDTIQQWINNVNYEYITEMKNIGISKNGYDEYAIYYDISNKPKFFMAFKTFEMAKEIANKLDEIYHLGGQN